jgi:tetratricopeptide (TPR) repeat protein
VRACFATILAIQGEVVESAGEIEALLGSERPLSPASAYAARQTFCRILFGAGFYEEAAMHAQELLALVPEDPWALQHRAAARAAAHIGAGRAGDAAAIEEVRQLYAPALVASQGATPIARDYLEHMSALAGLEIAIDAAAALREAYSQRGLGFIHGLLLTRAGRAEQAAAAMLDALMHSEAIVDSDDLYQAIAAILEGRGAEAGAQAVLDLPETATSVPRAMCERVLGLLLARHEEMVALARQLLEAAVAAQPDDASATLYLGDVAETEELREARYQRALLLAPSWSYARYRLANYLLDRDRPGEALEFTSGHAEESVELLELHGRALLFVGRYDEAAAAYAQTAQLVDAPPPWLCYYKWLAEDNAGQHEAAAATARLATQHFADDPSWYVQLATSLANLGQYDAALLAAGQGQAIGIGEIDGLEITYTIAWARHDLPAALGVVEQALAGGLELPEGQLHAWERRQLRLLLDLGREDQARTLLAARSLDADGWGQAAWVAMEAERWSLLTEFADQALALEPEHFAGLFARATALREQDHEAEAVEAYHRLRRAHPHEHNAYEKLGLLLALEGQTEDALELADRALGLGPFCYMAWATRGYVAFVRGEDDKALADFETSWSRANVDQRRGEHAFWWVRAALRGDEAAAAASRDQALARAHTAIDRRQIDQIDALLGARTQRQGRAED